MYTDYYIDSNMDLSIKKDSKYADIKYLIIDVDGTMTDSGIYYDENGNELKKFCTKDATGFFAAKVSGIKIIVLTGRECMATKRRMQELKVDYIQQGVVDKVTFIKEFMIENGLKNENLAYIGDDLNDFMAMKLAGFVGCPEDAADEIKEISDYISGYKGGYGAVRDVIRFILEDRGQWKTAICRCYKII